MNRNLARLKAIVAELPDYLQSGSIFSNTVVEYTPGQRENYPVSVSGALDLAQQLQSAGQLSADEQAELSSLMSRLQSIKRFYPNAWQDKIRRELQSRANGLRWVSEDAARERQENDLEDRTAKARADSLRRILNATRGEIDITPYQKALEEALSSPDED